MCCSVQPVCFHPENVRGDQQNGLDVGGRLQGAVLQVEDAMPGVHTGRPREQGQGEGVDAACQGVHPC